MDLGSLVARALAPLLAVSLAPLGCGTQPGPASAEGGVASVSTGPSPSPSPPPAAGSTGAAVATATSTPSEPPDGGAAAGSQPAPGATVAPSPPPAGVAVKVENIGMHIGGGPNDAPTKAPIKRSMEPHFDALKRCFGHVDDKAKGGDFGVDLLIPAQGGKAKVTHPRTALRGEGFSACVVQVFADATFEKPAGGLTMVSYSLRFTPESSGARPQPRP